MRYDEPDCKGDAFIILTCIVGLFAAIVFGAWCFFAEAPQPPQIVEVVSDEGQAKAVMIYELTGYEFPPDIAKWADVKFSGSTVSIDTHTINLWDGKQWREIER